MKDYQFNSVFGPFFLGYLELREASGYETKAYGYMFSQFDRFLEDKGVKDALITKQLIEDWRISRTYDAPYTLSHKYSAWANIGRYMQELGIKCYIAKNPSKVRCRENFVPYVFTEREMSDLFAKSTEISTCEYRRVSGYQSFPAILSTLYSTGIRVGECLRLNYDDVNFPNRTILIKDTKNRTERIVPISPSLFDVLSVYESKRREVVIHSRVSSNKFFLKNDGTAISHSCVNMWFRRLLALCHIPMRGNGFGPRLHDLRHTFAVHSLKKMVNDGMNMYSAFSILSAVMGHKNISSTEYYIRLTAASYPKIVKLTSAQMSDVYP